MLPNVIDVGNYMEKSNGEKSPTSGKKINENYDFLRLVTIERQAISNKTIQSTEFLTYNRIYFDCNGIFLFHRQGFKQI